MAGKDAKRWEKWVDSWNGMKAADLEKYLAENEEAMLVKIAPEELQLKLVQKHKRLAGKEFPISLTSNKEGDDTTAAAPKGAPGASKQPGEEAGDSVKAGLPSKSDLEAIEQIKSRRKKTMAEDELGKQADLLDAADHQVVTKKIILSEQQQFIAGLVEAAEDAAPRIDITELSTRVMMLIPSIIKKARPEFGYKWASIDHLQSELHTFGGMWEVVARINHGHLPERLFGPEGSIMYKGQSILVFTRRSITDHLERQVIQELDLRVREATQSMDKSYKDPRGKEQVRLEIIDKEPPGRVGSEELTKDSFNAQGQSVGDYDFPDTGADAT